MLLLEQGKTQLNEQKPDLHKPGHKSAQPYNWFREGGIATPILNAGFLVKIALRTGPDL